MRFIAFTMMEVIRLDDHILFTIVSNQNYQSRVFCQMLDPFGFRWLGFGLEVFNPRDL